MAFLKESESELNCDRSYSFWFVVIEKFVKRRTFFDQLKFFPCFIKVRLYCLFFLFHLFVNACLFVFIMLSEWKMLV